MRVSVRRLKPVDWQEFYPLFKLVLEEDFSRYPREARELFMNETKLKGAFERKKREFWVAEGDGKIIGFLTAIGSPGGVTFINWLGVRKEFRGQGVGSSLVKTWEVWAKNNSYHKLRAQTTNIENKLFYERLGFRLEGIKKNDLYHLDHLIFGKTISS